MLKAFLLHIAPSTVGQHLLKSIHPWTLQYSYQLFTSGCKSLCTIDQPCAMEVTAQYLVWHYHLVCEQIVHLSKRCYTLLTILPSIQDVSTLLTSMLHFSNHLVSHLVGEYIFHFCRKCYIILTTLFVIQDVGTSFACPRNAVRC